MIMILSVLWVKVLMDKCIKHAGKQVETLLVSRNYLLSDYDRLH